ncbi:MAG: helix-turn-helix transcriptional regulator [Oscillospiraceae bacterium]|nr:helix-turn-helix transcriptional regulator [Oscillospiraceae bacterium]
MENLFFTRFQNLCRRNGTTVNAVGRIVGASSGSITAWKQGTEPRPSMVLKIAEYFGVTSDYLLGLDEKPADVLDQVDVAWYGQFQELTEEQKDIIRDMVAVMRKRKGD